MTGVPFNLKVNSFIIAQRANSVFNMMDTIYGVVTRWRGVQSGFTRSF